MAKAKGFLEPSPTPETPEVLEPAPETSGPLAAREPGIVNSKSDSSPGFCDIPASKDPAFPKRFGNPDWVAAVKQYDLELVTEMCSLFPKDAVNPLTSPQVARKYVQRRQNLMTGKDVRLLVNWYRKVQWTGEERPEWVVLREYSQLLEQKHLKHILPACRATVLEDLKASKQPMKLRSDEDTPLATLHTVQDRLEKGYQLSELTGMPVAAILTARRKGLPGWEEIRDTSKSEILAELGYFMAWGGLFQQAGVDLHQSLGVTAKEIDDAQHDCWDPFEDEIKELESYLN